jgi:glycosyltransferase involved in cell wall biosynthesis
MSKRRPRLTPLADRGPLRVMFVISSMPVGGAETLLVNLVRRLDRDRFAPQLCCLQALGPLGEVLSGEIPAFSHLIDGKYDVGVLFRLARLFRRQRIDAVVTVGAGDKMFWGRIAARLAGVPVICSALHSTGWPDVIERPNRWRLLTRWTDAFIGVAPSHGRHLVEVEGFPESKVRVIPNGIDVARFAQAYDAAAVRRGLGIDEKSPLVGIVAALRTEKNHALLLRAFARVRSQIPAAKLLIVGDGPERAGLVQLATELELAGAVHFLGNRPDVPELLSALDVFVLTSRMEANPVSILEAMASGKPVVAPRVGSIAESVADGRTGFLTEPSNEAQVADRLVQLLGNRSLAREMGQGGQAAVVEHGSLERMVSGYEELLTEIYDCKANGGMQAVAGAKIGGGAAEPHVGAAP